MVMQVLSKVFGSKNERELKRMGKVATGINAFEDEFEKLDDDPLPSKCCPQNLVIQT